MKKLVTACVLPFGLLAGGCASQSPPPTVQQQPPGPATVLVQPAPGERSASDAGTPSAAARLIPAGQDNSSLLLGNPSQAGKDENNFLAQRPQHALSYNRAAGGPNWVAWHVEKSDLGSVRRGDFLPDPLLPAAWQIRPSDYRGSGYDRGHVCPSGDRTRTRADNTATFVMSNMLPQAAALNQQVWKDLEDYSRSQIRSNANELYVIAGGHGSAGRIAGGKVNVPAVCWKIILVLPRGDNDLARINKDTRVIAVSMPNRQRQEIADSKWSQWITSVAQLEKTTGYDFLSALPDDVEKALEQKVDSGSARSAARTTRTVTTVTVVPPAPDPQRPATTLVVPPVQQAPSIRPAPSSQIAPSASPIPPMASDQASAIQVWVNTKSGIYHYPGARWYGKTKEGAYMSEAQAQAQGYRAAYNGQ